MSQFMKKLILLILFVEIYATGGKEIIQSVNNSLVLCDDLHLMLPCIGTGPEDSCVERFKICDGERNCRNGEDEENSLCSSWKCEKGLRCEESDICIPTPHRTLCSGGESIPHCPDGSDQAYCLHKLYNGALLNTSVGLRLLDRKNCFCELRDDDGSRLYFKSVGKTFRSSHIMATVCIERNDPLVCNGVVDCVDGEDELPEMCGALYASAREEDRHIEMEDFQMREFGARSLNFDEPQDDRMMNDINKGDGSLPDNSQLDMEDDLSQPQPMLDTEIGASFLSPDINFLVKIFSITLALVLAICLLIILVIINLSRRTNKGGNSDSEKQEDQKMAQGFVRQISSTSATNNYAPPPKPSSNSTRRTWSLRSSSIIKELGRGFYSKVYLAQNDKEGFVAMKTTDNQKKNSDECIENEISILSRLPQNLNIVKLIAQNLDEKLIILEYCFHGNLKDYVQRHREYFINELDQETQELDSGCFFYSCPSAAETSPVAEFLTSIHDKMNLENPEERKADVPVLRMSKTLLKTRRLLYWSNQIGNGLKFLADHGIIHRDVALRNMLLTNSDIVKISDFGLATNIDKHSPIKKGSKHPQYWSRSSKPQPFKWMALESFDKNVFSQQTDVWAFGVTLWELFTLGGEPYGDVNPLELQKFLFTGGRLQDTAFAPRKVANLMKKCWLVEPTDRPTFSQIVDELSAYVSNPGKTINEGSRLRLDSGLGEPIDGYVEMATPRESSGFSTPSTSKFSTRSRPLSRASSSLVSRHHTDIYNDGSLRYPSSTLTTTTTTFNSNGGSVNNCSQNSPTSASMALFTELANTRSQYDYLDQHQLARQAAAMAVDLSSSAADLIEDKDPPHAGVSGGANGRLDFDVDGHQTYGERKPVKNSLYDQIQNLAKDDSLVLPTAASFKQTGQGDSGSSGQDRGVVYWSNYKIVNSPPREKPISTIIET